MLVQMRWKRNMDTLLAQLTDFLTTVVGAILTSFSALITATEEENETRLVPQTRKER